MGAMKRIYTETRANKSLLRFAPEERDAIRQLLSTQAARHAVELEASKPKPEAGGVDLGSFYLKIESTGRKPAKAGRYCVADTLAEMTYVLTVEYQGGEWWIWQCGDSMRRPLSGWNRPHYSWFLMPELGREDFREATKIISV